ncbi:MAG TPA: hypothetical protein PLF88_10770, partial [Opitutaceae bacterium]|nr:hypothetical protein [Opitutaceae bacterium]
MKSLRVLPGLLLFLTGALSLPGQTTVPGADDFERAMLAMQNVDPETAGPLMRQAAEAGHVEAMFQLGELHAQGYGAAKSEAEAMRWYGAAAA